MKYPDDIIRSFERMKKYFNGKKSRYPIDPQSISSWLKTNNYICWIGWQKTYCVKLDPVKGFIM